MVPQMTEFSFGFSKIFILCLYFQPSGSLSAGFTSSPPTSIQASVGDNVTLTWGFALVPDTEKYFQESVVGTRSSDNAFVRLVSVSRIGAVGRPTPPDNALSLQKRLFFVGNASLYRLSEFLLTNVQASDDKVLLLCAIKMQTQYTFSNESVVSLGTSSSSSPSSSSSAWIYIVITVVGVVVLVVLAVRSYKKKKRASPRVHPQPVIVGQANSRDD